MRLISLLASALVGSATLLAPAAQAAPVSFDFTKSASTATTTFASTGGNGFGNGFVYTDRATGLTATVTAWSLTGERDVPVPFFPWLSYSVETFESAKLGQHGAGNGLGVCNRDEGACGAPQHAADSSGADDFFLIRFGAPVDPASITIRPVIGSQIRIFGQTIVTSDTDLAYATGNLPIGVAPSGMTLSELLGGLGDSLTADPGRYSPGARTVPLAGAERFDTLLVGARDLGDNSFFKLMGVTVDHDVPVPGTVALLGLAALGLGVARRRG